jgi:hypothetical protein
LSGDVRRLTLDDLPGCLDLAADREWPREEHKWRLLFEVGDVLGIVETGEAVVGTTVITRYDPVLYATEYGRLPDGDLTRRFAPLMQALG